MLPILSMMRKDFRQIFRNRQMLFLIFFVPLVQLFVLGNAITTEVKHLKLLVVDLDQSRESAALVRAFAATDRFELVGRTADQRTITEGMKAWQVQLALVIPPHFGRELERRLLPQVQLVVDGVDGNSAGVALGYARGVLTGFGQAQAQERGLVAAKVHLVRLEEQMWYNPELSSRQYMVPGIVVVLLTLLPMMLSSMSLVREQEIGTLEQLMVTPLTKYQLLLGKLIPFLVLSCAELALVTAAAVSFFGIAMQGSYALLAGLALVYLFTTLGLGIFISTLARSQQQAMFIAWFFMVFMVLMGGFFIPIDNMPPLLQKLTYLNPMRYFMAITRDLFQKGSSLELLLGEAVPMAAFGVVIFSFGVLRFRKSIG
ncbi:MAG: ABC transporter permease [Candidatus Latescibacteria bacterium]|nr:ABC transporter permease [Candidatus Latescibacterota bacterium]